MSISTYRDEAVRHAWEFILLGLERAPDLRALHTLAQANPAGFETWLAGDVTRCAYDLVSAVPSRRNALLRRIAKDDGPAQVAVILAAWKHCRCAYHAYERLGYEESGPRGPWREATREWGFRYGRRVAKWPCQWGPSPFGRDTGDFIAMIDTFDPGSGAFDC